MLLAHFDGHVVVRFGACLGFEIQFPEHIVERVRRRWLLPIELLLRCELVRTEVRRDRVKL